MFTEATAAFLRELLNQPPPKGRYRELWIAKVENARGKEISQAAVARVITEYLSAKGRPAPDPRSLRNLVSRALTGAKLTKDTLTLFIEAFDITGEDTQKLWMLFTGGKRADFVDMVDWETADWTADPRTGRANSSPAFQKAVDGVESLIHARFPEKSGKDARDLAVRIVAYLAHGEHLRPRG